LPERKGGPCSRPGSAVPIACRENLKKGYITEREGKTSLDAGLRGKTYAAAATRCGTNLFTIPTQKGGKGICPKGSGMGPPLLQREKKGS